MTCPACQASNEDAAETCFNCGQPLAVVVTRGTVIASRYEILSSLGRGGMGVVYKAHDRTLDENVALKMLRSEIVGEPIMERRFRSEIKLARRVSHKNVCRIHEYGEHGRLRYISMEFVEGVNLKEVLREKEALPVKSAFDVAIQVAEGLQAIHDVGIIHRDLKTTNLMRDARGVVRLMDFGIAKQSEADATTGTVSGAVGTPEYMSPEQARSEKVDFRSDIYALGIVVFELFTGRVPFKGDTPLSTMLKHLQDPPPLDGPEAAALPRALAPVLRKALAKQRSERYASARDMGDALRQARSQTFPDVTPTPVPILSATAPEAETLTRPMPLSPEPTPVPTSVPTVVPTAPLPSAAQATPTPPGRVSPAASIRRPPLPDRPTQMRASQRAVPTALAVLFTLTLLAVVGIAYVVSTRIIRAPSTVTAPSVPSPTGPAERAPAAAAPAKSTPQLAPATSVPDTSPTPAVGNPRPADRAGRVTPAAHAERTASTIPRVPAEAKPSLIERLPVSPSEVSPIPSAGAQASPASVPPQQPESTPALSVQDATLQIVVRPWAEVSIDGMAIGMTPLGKIRLPAGAHSIALSHPDYRPWKRRLELKAGESATLKVDLTFEGIPR